ncbi:unnamed protein product [Urochloa humidicola]
MPNSLAHVAVLVLAAGYVVAAAAALASATTFVVGDDQGWTMGVDYVAWVKGKTFQVGDKLAVKKHCSVQLPERGAHGDGGGEDRLLRLRRRQPAEQRPQRLDQRHAHGPRHALLHLQHPRTLHHRHEDRRHRRWGRRLAPGRHSDRHHGSTGAAGDGRHRRGDRGGYGQARVVSSGNTLSL